MLFQLGVSKSQETDSKLLSKYLSTGDIEYLGILYARYMHLVYGVCLKYLKNREQSQDETIQIFEKLIEEVRKYNVQDFKLWLYTVTKNHCLMLLRKEKSKSNKHEKYILFQEKSMESSIGMHHNNDNSLEQNLEALRKCIEELKKEQRQSVELFFFDKMCYEEIAHKMNCEIKSIKSYIQNGKRKLKICLGRNG